MESLMRIMVVGLGLLAGCTGTTQLTDVSDGSDVSDDSDPPGPVGIDPTLCKLADTLGGGVHFGSPRSSDRLRSTGPVKVTVLFGTYADVTPERTPEEVFALLSPGAQEMFSAMSYGRMSLTLEPHLEWLALSKPASDYAQAIRTFEGHKAFLEEGIRLSDEAVDFSQTDLVLLIGPPSARAVGYGPTWIGFDEPNGRIVADGKTILNGITSGADLLFWGSPWLNHEMGHSMSLPDLYSYGGEGGFSRPFGLMDVIDSAAPEYFAYERWHLGWVDDDQVLCDAFDQDIPLEPVEVPGGFKQAIAKISETRVVVVESRRAVGFDSALADEGVVVYIVDSSIPSGAGPLEVLNDRKSLAPGEQVVVEGITIAVTESGTQADVIRMKKD